MPLSRGWLESGEIGRDVKQTGGGVTLNKVDNYNQANSWENYSTIIVADDDKYEYLRKVQDVNFKLS